MLNITFPHFINNLRGIIESSSSSTSHVYHRHHYLLETLSRHTIQATLATPCWKAPFSSGLFSRLLPQRLGEVGVFLYTQQSHQITSRRKPEGHTRHRGRDVRVETRVHYGTIKPSKWRKTRLYILGFRSKITNVICFVWMVFLLKGWRGLPS